MQGASKPFRLNEIAPLLLKLNKILFKRGKSGLLGPDSKGRTTGGTLGRCKSTVAYRAQSSGGGGVLNKLRQASHCSSKHVACHNVSLKAKVSSPKSEKKEKACIYRLIP